MFGQGKKEKRFVIKEEQSLGFMSPRDYRQSLGIAV